MAEIRSICVFCGSSMGKSPMYRKAAGEMATLILERNMELVYGGANVGLMKVFADTILDGGGKVVGVMPRSLVEKEVAHLNLTHLHIVESMQQRKVMMAKLSDAFVALPGGFGTLDELAEMITYNQLRIHDKPLGILNTAGYFDHLLSFLDHGVEEKYIRIEHRENLIVDEKPGVLIKKMQRYKPVEIGKWIIDIKHESNPS
ncbi:MAG: TIGR00730 family Rossman fold protein [Bacteroidales bacterium]|nr:TIGR00730 family Rossman fold protein [Bacteroidales bacterium]MCF8344359.1 TIGR00730 family Rossman fold protein [Bacteroidales bacterium]MCF8376243.1 TIGR00730 family Rossman fold protein [Bacteroidales bacterium]MCF8401200.1 TIGR00730 family Rossman fold protein [Bacteroidales bacterium]